MYKCTVCAKRQLDSPSSERCINCKEEFCLGCSARHTAFRKTRLHFTIPIEKYAQITKSVQRDLWYFLNCCEHSQTFRLFCKRHKIVCCSEGISKYHNECQDICYLDQLVNVTDFTKLISKIEMDVLSMDESIVQLADRCSKSLESLSKQRTDMDQKIKHLRDTSDDKQYTYDKLSIELCRVADLLRNRINKINEGLNQCKGFIHSMKTSIGVFKTLPERVETFLFWNSIEMLVTSKSKYIASLVVSEILSEFYIVCDVDASLMNLSNSESEMGIKKSNVFTKYTKKKSVLSSQATESHQKENRLISIDDIVLRRNLTIRIRESNMRGCFMLKDGRMFVTSYCICNILALNPNGTEDYRFKLRPHTAYDIAYMESENAIVGASIGNGCIILIDLDDRTVKRTIYLADEDVYNEDEVYSVAVVGSKIFFTGDDKGIQMLDLEDESVRCIVPGVLPSYTYITVFDEKIFHSNCETDEITCYDLNGKVIWTFCDEQILSGPVGLSTDASGNVFVLGFSSNNLVVISADGKHIRELLWDIHDLESPRTIFYNKLTDQILLANDQNFAFLYDVI